MPRDGVYYYDTPGTHLESATRTETTDGMVFDVDLHAMVPYHHVDAEYEVSTVLTTRPPTYHGDHHTAYDWGRGVSRVTSDSPFVLYHHYDNPIDHLTSNYQLTQIEFLSKYRTPFSSSPVNGPDVENAQNEAITQALNSLRGASSNWGSDLGEMKDSVESLSRDAMRAVGFLRNMRHGRWGQAADALGISRKSFSNSTNRGRALADYWLGYSYGWRPLAQTMHDTQSVMADIVNRKSNLIEGTGSGHASGSGTGYYYGKIKEQNSWFGSAKCTLKAKVDNYNLFNLNKVGLTNPISIAWELVPFSFAIDWFMPIGNTLQALSAGHGLTFVGGWSNTITRANISLTRDTGVETAWTTCESGGYYSEEQFTFNRTALAAFPYARFYADLTPYSTPRAANALALVRTLT